MKASTLAFKYRYSLHAIIYTLGFWAPWNYPLHLDAPGINAHVWGILAVNLTQIGVSSLYTAFNILLALGIFLASAGALLRTWGTAYIGANIVNSRGMHTCTAPADGILKDGPFAHVRNPLYLGTFLHTIAVALLMPRSGAIFTIVLIGALQIRLILSEEAFLRQKVAAPFQAYCTLVPRLLPALRPRVAPDGLIPRWRQAFVGEFYFWGVAVSLATAGWRYNASLLIQCVIVSAGIALVLHAFIKKP